MGNEKFFQMPPPVERFGLKEMCEMSGIVFEPTPIDGEADAAGLPKQEPGSAAAVSMKPPLAANITEDCDDVCPEAGDICGEGHDEIGDIESMCLDVEEFLKERHAEPDETSMFILETFHERAAIMHYDGGLDEETAFMEAEARLELLYTAEEIEAAATFFSRQP